MPDIDYTQVLIAIIVVFLPAILRELRAMFDQWLMSRPDVAYNLARAAEFGVQAAQVMKENGVWSDEKGAQAEQHAVDAAQAYLDRLGVQIDVDLLLDAVRAAWLAYNEQKENYG